MRCQHEDDDIQCRMDATRRVLVGCGGPPDPDQSGFAGTVYLVQVCKQHNPDPGGRSRCPALPVPCRSASARGGRSYPPRNRSRSWDAERRSSIATSSALTSAPGSGGLRWRCRFIPRPSLSQQKDGRIRESAPHRPRG